jgi:hypothetical protein
LIFFFLLLYETKKIMSNSPIHLTEEDAIFGGGKTNYNYLGSQMLRKLVCGAFRSLQYLSTGNRNGKLLNDKRSFGEWLSMMKQVKTFATHPTVKWQRGLASQDSFWFG